MYWNVIGASVPRDKETVLIQIGVEFDIAVYDAEKKMFVLKSGEKIEMGRKNLQWVRVEPPNVPRD